MTKHEDNDAGRRAWDSVAGVAFDGGCLHRSLPAGVLGAGVCWAEKEIRRLRESLGAEQHLGEGYRFLFPGERIRMLDDFWSPTGWVSASPRSGLYVDSVMGYRRKIVVESDGYRWLDIDEPARDGDEIRMPSSGWQETDETFAKHARRVGLDKVWRRACPDAKLPPEEPKVYTLHSCRSSVELCRENGWGVGTILEGRKGEFLDRIRITAIGESSILAARVESKKSESGWDLTARDWRKVGGPTA